MWAASQKEIRMGCTMEDEPVALQMTSPAFKHEGMIPIKYTCDGQDINPQLIITGVPENAQSLALIVDDPDAPGGNWDHWLVWNIDPATRTIPEASTPNGAIQGKNDFKQMKFGGPCPPSGTHRYYFKLYALDNKPDLPEGADKKALENAIRGHILDKSILIGRYTRRFR